MIKRYNIKHDGIYYEAFYKCKDADPYLIDWHHLDDNPEDLPEEDGVYFVKIFDRPQVTANYSIKYNMWQIYIPNVALLFQPELKDIIEWAYIPKGDKP